MENQCFQETENKKRYLKRYRKHKENINRLEKKLGLLEDRIMSVRTANFSGMPRGGTPITLDELLGDKIELEKRIARLKKRGRIIKAEILDAIDSLEDSRYIEVLEYYCIDCLSMDDISYETGYTVRHVYTLYSDAISLISVKGQ